MSISSIQDAAGSGLLPLRQKRVEDILQPRILKQIEFDQPTLADLVGHNMKWHVAPAYAFQKQPVFRTQIGQPPSSRADDGKLPSTKHIARRKGDGRGCESARSWS